MGMLKTISKTSVAVIACSIMVSCAQNPNNIHPTYVAHDRYAAMSCQELRIEAESVSRHAAILAGRQTNEEAQDAVALGVGLLLFFPALYLVEGNSGNAAKLAYLKGQADAIEQASGNKQCGIKFRS